MNNIVIAYSGSHDWTGIYVDGILIKEAHSFNPSEVLSALGISHRAITAPDSVIENLGLPKKFQEFEDIVEDEMNCRL